MISISTSGILCVPDHQVWTLRNLVRSATMVGAFFISLGAAKADSADAEDAPQIVCFVGQTEELNPRVTRAMVLNSELGLDAEDKGEFIQVSTKIGANKDGVVTEAFQISIILPTAPRDLRLILQTQNPEDVASTISATFNGEEIARQRTGELLPMMVDVSNLPRKVPLVINFTAYGAGQGCLTLDLGTRDRPASVLIESVDLHEIPAMSLGRTIAQATGRFAGGARTNSHDGLNANLARFDAFEVDLNWTTDGELVCLNNWLADFDQRFKSSEERPISLSKFRAALKNSPDGPQNCDLDSLAKWMRENPSARILTDVKKDRIEAHDLIAQRYPDLLGQFVAQAFQPAEVLAYREFGFRDVIFSLYQFGRKQDRVLNAITTSKPNAISMPISFAMDGLIESISNVADLPVYVHTVNNLELASCLYELGAAGLFSDQLGSTELPNLPAAPPSCVVGTGG